MEVLSHGKFVPCTNSQKGMKVVVIMKKRKYVSLAAKLAMLVSFIAVGITAVSIIVSYMVHCSTENEYYIEMVSHVANTVASQLDGEKVRELADAVQDKELEHLSKAGDNEAVLEWLQQKDLYDSPGLAMTFKDFLHIQN